MSKHYYDLYPPVEQAKLPENLDAPEGMPGISCSVWGEFQYYSDINVLFNVTKCEQDDKTSIHGKECHVPDNKVRELRHVYYSCVSYTDTQIGKVISELEKQGIADDTIIVLWSDHGW